MSTRFGIEPHALARLLAGCLKPEEIAGDPVTQHKRVRELLHWFARPPEFAGNPKWLRAHALELAYYIAAGSKLESIDLDALEKDAFKAGFNVTPQERAALERTGFGRDTNSPQPPPATEPSSK